MNILIYGGLDFDDYVMFNHVMRTIEFPPGTVFLSCHRGGTDKMAESWGKFKGHRVFSISGTFSGWDAVQNADGVVVFWDGKDRQVSSLIRNAKMARRKTVVFDYKGRLIENYEPELP